MEDLFEKFLNRNCTSDELRQLFEHFRTTDEDMLRQLIKAELIRPDSDVHTTEERQVRLANVHKNIKDHIARQETPSVKPFPFRKYITVAAALITFAFIGYYLYKSYNPVTKQAQMTSIYGDDVAPGTNKASITLSDGTVIELSEDQQGIIASGTQLSYADGEKLYDNTKDIQYATLNTPRGGQYRLTLPDGTKVILNAESSLTYPTIFTDKQRKVELKGEAFFDVAENKAQPFIVATEQQQVIVTGTTFNVNAYGDNNRTITTLVTGSVNVKSNSGASTATLKPGQEALYSSGTIKTKMVDTHVATGWAEGVFVFKYKSLAEILPQLERWYDIQVDIDPIPNEEFYAEIDRNTPLSTVLESMEQTSSLRFEIKERRLTLKKK